MTSIALFSNKAGAGTTTVAYHLAHMCARLGRRVLAVDLDPQSDLTARCLDQAALEELWEDAAGPADAAADERGAGGSLPAGAGGTVADAVRPLLEGTGDVRPVRPAAVAPGLWLLPGSLGFSRFEDTLAGAWARSYSGDLAAIRTTAALHRVVQGAAAAVDADVVLLDLGPGLGAINRASLLAADAVLTPLAPDVRSVQGVRALGPALRGWRRDWQQSFLPHVAGAFPAPGAAGQALGYVYMWPEVRLGSADAAMRVLVGLSSVFEAAVTGRETASPDPLPYQIESLQNYRSLAPLARDARKPMFDLKPADGALGSTQKYVRTCYQHYQRLAEAVLAWAEGPETGPETAAGQPAEG